MSEAEPKNYPAIFLSAVKPTGYNMQPHPLQKEKPHAVSLDWALKKPGRFLRTPAVFPCLCIRHSDVSSDSFSEVLRSTNPVLYKPTYCLLWNGAKSLIFIDNCSPPFFFFPLGGQLLVLWHTAAPPSVCRLLTYWVDKHFKLLRSAASLKLH